MNSTIFSSLPASLQSRLSRVAIFFCALLMAGNAPVNAQGPGSAALNARNVSDSSIGTAGMDYLPGIIIVKLEDEHVFFKKTGDAHPARKKGRAGGPESDARPDPVSRPGMYAKPNPDAGPLSILTGYLDRSGVTAMDPVFREGASSRTVLFKQAGSDPVRLQELTEGFERTYMISYSSGEDPQSLAGRVARLPGVIYAEPHYVHETMDQYIPNDPLINNPGHDYFEYQNFFEAWGISRGSSDVVISIVDSGVYYDHPDLAGKLWRNPDPGRANEFFPWEIRNDTIGWNFWESGDVFAGEPPVQNGNPVGNYSTHGTHVAGTAAADTDNGTGVAGTGFHSIFMPVKVGGTRQYPRNIAYGYAGILYAAVYEADVINCSFGGTNFSEFGRDVVEFAIAAGSVVVAAAGNSGNDLLFYPAAFDDVIAVGSVKREYNDIISHFSNYGFYVDVFAMGEGVLSTFFIYDAANVSWTPAYQRNTGTSMAAPVVSGLAALIKAANPDWPPQRIANQIRANARDLSFANPDNRFENRLGKGLIDAGKALRDMKPGLRIADFAFETEGGGKINAGEKGTLTLSGVNHGAASSAARFQIRASQTGIKIQPQSVNIGTLGSGEAFEITFDVEISADYRLDEIPLLRVNAADDALDYRDFTMIEYERLLFDIVDINTITTSFSSDGTIGYMDAFSAYGGVGFIPGNYSNVLFEGGLMISADAEVDFLASPAEVAVNQVRETDHIARHFLPEKNYRFGHPPKVSDIDGSAVFRSSQHPVFKELMVTMNTYAFDRPGLDRAVFVTYDITNSSMGTLRNVHAGLFNDWDIHDPNANNTGFVQEDSLIYAYAPGRSPYVAVANLGAVSSAFAIDGPSEMSLPNARSREDSLKFGIFYREDRDNFDGFTDAEKRLALTAGTERTTIANTDISIVTATGPFTLLPFATVRVGFVYAWGDNLEALRSQVEAARAMDFDISAPGEYARRGILADRATLYQNFPNPFNTSTVIEFHLAGPGHAELAVYNILGQRVATLFNGQAEHRSLFIPFDASMLASGVYIAVLRAENRTETMKMTLVK